MREREREREREGIWVPSWQDSWAWAKGTLAGLAYVGSSALGDGQSFLR